MPPWNKLFSRLSSLREDKLAKDREIVPWSCKLGRFRATTCWLFELHVTPNQEQNDAFLVQLLAKKWLGLIIRLWKLLELLGLSHLRVHMIQMQRNVEVEREESITKCSPPYVLFVLLPKLHHYIAILAVEYYFSTRIFCLL